MANRRLKLGRVGVVGNRDDDLNIVGCRSSLELGLGFDHEFDPGVSVSFNHAFNPDQWFHLRIVKCSTLS